MLISNPNELGIKDLAIDSQQIPHVHGDYILSRETFVARRDYSCLVSSRFEERKISEQGWNQATFLSCAFLSNRAFYILCKGIFLKSLTFLSLGKHVLNDFRLDVFRQHVLRNASLLYSGKSYGPLFRYFCTWFILQVEKPPVLRRSEAHASSMHLPTA